MVGNSGKGSLIREEHKEERINRSDIGRVNIILIVSLLFFCSLYLLTTQILWGFIEATLFSVFFVFNILLNKKYLENHHKISITFQNVYIILASLSCLFIAVLISLLLFSYGFIVSSLISLFCVIGITSFFIIIGKKYKLISY